MAVVYGLWQKPVRISHVTIYGADPVPAGRQESLASVASAAMQGAYLGIIPRDSTFFYPASAIRADILATDSDIAAVSLFREGFTGLSVKVSGRVPIARWCGRIFATSTPVEESNCYFFDANSLLYATSSDAVPVNSFAVYTPIATATQPLGATLPHNDALPAAFDFARQLTALGSPVKQIIFRDTEVDDYLASGTRVTYLLGDERDTYTALVSARASLNLVDGSLDYVDLRFSGKVYLKKKE